MIKSIFAVEGLVHAGKSTLIRGLGADQRILCVPEYIDFTDEGFPDPPKNIEDARAADLFFLNLEHKRRQMIRENHSIVFLDRSVLSIIAYNYAAEGLTSGKVPCFTHGQKSFKLQDWVFPQTCIYLDISDEEIDNRHTFETGQYKSIFLNRKFNALLRKFYEKEMTVMFPWIELISIDAMRHSQQILSEVRKILVSKSGQ